MALSGSFETNHFSNSTVKETWMVFNWWASQRIPENDSTVSWNVTVRRNSTSWVQFYNTTINVNGQNYGQNGRYSENEQIASGSFSVSHDPTGKGSFWVSISANVYYSAGGYIGASQSPELDTIPRQANITYAPDFNDEQNPTINYNNPAGNNVTALKACISIDGSKDNIAYRDISKTGSSYTFNLTDAERKILRQNCLGNDSRIVKFFITTTIGENTFYESTDRTFRVINANPTLNPTVKDVLAASLALTGDENKIIKGFNKIEYTSNAQALKEASISSYMVKSDVETKTTSTGSFSNVENSEFIFKTTDNRNLSTEKTIKKTLIDYVKLTCNLKAGNPTADGDMAFEITGNYFNSTFGKVANTLSLAWRYKENNGAYSSWTAITPSKTGNIYNATVNLTGLNYQSTYTFQARAIDKINTSGALSPERKVKTIPIFDWGEKDFNINGDLLIKEENIFTKICNLIYPVGSIYMSVNNVNPGTIFGGTWVAWGTGKVPVGIDTSQTEFNTVEKTGGAKNVTLTVNQMPRHNHGQDSHSHQINEVNGDNNIVASGGYNNNGNQWGANFIYGGQPGAWGFTNVSNFYTRAAQPGIWENGNSEAHTNLQPYITCYMFKRVS